MVHPDIRPQKLWVEQVAAIFKIEPRDIYEATLWHHYGGLKVEYVSWEPVCEDPRIPENGYPERPHVSLAWCTRCLAEDMSAVQPGRIKREWLFAHRTFCPKHGWPLVDHCENCGYGSNLQFNRKGWVGPYCGKCGFPLTRAPETYLRTEKFASKAWRRLADFETAVFEVIINKAGRKVAVGRDARTRFLRNYRNLANILVGPSHQYSDTTRGIDHFETLAVPFRNVVFTWLPSRSSAPSTYSFPLRMRISAVIGALFDETGELAQLLYQRTREQMLGHMRFVFGFLDDAELREVRTAYPTSFIDALVQAKPRHALPFYEGRSRPHTMLEAMKILRKTGELGYSA